jgi:hypothetical protein
MKKLLILLLLSSCVNQKKAQKNLKTTHVDNSVTYTYDSTVWKVVPMTKEDSVYFKNIIESKF